MASYNCYFSHDLRQEDDDNESVEMEYTTVQIRLWKLEEQDVRSRQCRICPADVVSRLEAPTLELATSLTELQVLEWCQPRMIELATEYIREICPAPVTLLMEIMEVQEEDVDEGVPRSMEEEDGSIMMMPASEEAIAGLEKVAAAVAAVAAEREEGECPICLEKEEEEKGFARMPCSHAFHVKCIQVWLRISRFCPLCRFPMPC